MKRSYVNSILRDADAFIRSFGYVLPPFAYFTPEQMARAGGQYRERGLGWDITDYGQARFDELGLFLFTTRNGRLGDLRAGRGMLYAEKIMISRRDQLSPMHRHFLKAEENRAVGGGGEGPHVDVVGVGEAQDQLGRQRALVALDQGEVAGGDPKPLRHLRLGQLERAAQFADLRAEEELTPRVAIRHDKPYILTSCINFNSYNATSLSLSWSVRA